jgi:hypothetical protein
MIAVVYCSANFAGMALGISRRRMDSHNVTVPIATRTKQLAENMSPRSGFHERPTLLLRVTDRFSDVFVWMVGHGLLEGTRATQDYYTVSVWASHSLSPAPLSLSFRNYALG